MRLFRAPIPHFLVVLCAFLTLVGSPVPSAEKFEPRTGPVRVGVYNFYPLCHCGSPMNESSGKSVGEKGLFVDVLERIAETEGWELAYTNDTMRNLLARLRTGEIDLAVAISPGGDQAEGLAFSRETVISTWARVFTRPGVRIESPIGLASRAVGLMRDDPYNQEVRSIVRRLNIDCTFVEFPHYSEILGALEQGWIDVGVVDRLYAALHADEFRIESTPVLFSPIELRFAARPGRMEAELAAIDYHLDMMKRDVDSPYHLLIEHYLNRTEDRAVPRSLIYGFAITVVLLLLVGGVSVMLRRQVKRKTTELSDKNRDLQKEVRMRRQADATLTRQKEELARLATVIKQSSDCVVITDPDGLVEYVNPAFEIETEIGGHEIQGRPLRQFADESPLCRVATAMRDRAVSDPSVLLERFPLAPDGGKRTTIEATACIVRDESGRVRSYVINCRDVTRESQLETQLRQAQKMEAIGTLSGGIAHDFNNLLVPIIGYSEMMSGQLEGREREYVSKILEAAGRARDLVQQILAFSRQTEEERCALDVECVVREALRLLRATLPATIEIREQIGERCERILGDDNQIHQVVMNLCTNAYHAMRDQGGVLNVVLGAYVVESAKSTSPGLPLEPGRYLRLTVQDTGHGMDETVLSRIFDPYFTTKAQGDGTGLGLSIVHGIVQKHGGRIAVESRVGEGTRFDVYLPVAELIAPVSASTSEMLKTADSPSGERILLVDDEKEVLAMEKELLKDMRHEVTTASDSLEALQILRRTPYRFDLVITDQTMPRMTGVQLAREIRDFRNDLPVILCTGYTDALVKENAEALGLKACVRKPFTRADMLDAIRRALQTA